MDVNQFIYSVDDLNEEMVDLTGYKGVTLLSTDAV